MKRVVLLFYVLVGIFSAVNGQSPEKKWGISLEGGAEHYWGDISNDFYSFSQPYYGFGGITVGRNLTEHWDLMLNGTLGEIGHFESTSHFRYSLMQFNLSARYSFFKYEDVKLRPFLFAGLGYMSFTDKLGAGSKTAFELPDFGLGLNYKVSPTVSIVLKETFIYSSSDDVDIVVKGANEGYLQHSLGVTINFGKPKDTDGDGFADKIDLCPDVAGLEAFMGCPDTDGDGIADKDDACPNVAGLAKFNGCPDSDGDGVIDKEDACPNVAGLAKFNGCPDTDGDGIIDKDDACPNVAGPAKFNGCPDTDGDGIIDKNDACPNVAGLAKFGGCPDTDGDGIADKDDKCPTIAGVAENNGCPEVKAQDKEVLQKALHGIKFKSAKAIIDRSSYPILDNVVAIMKNNPTYNLKIIGHTDSQGDADFNLQLSKDRANAVKQYLINKGIDANRLSATGYGETKPIDDNNTPQGRANNRRVELIIEFQK